jgi:hypothetical protein
MVDENKVTKLVKFHGLPDVRISGQPDGEWYSTVGTNSLKVSSYFVEVEGTGDPEVIMLDDVINGLRIATERVQDLLIDEMRARQARKLRTPIDLPKPGKQKL